MMIMTILIITIIVIIITAQLFIQIVCENYFQIQDRNSVSAATVLSGTFEYNLDSSHLQQKYYFWLNEY
jgi:hypothetical protein